MPGQSDLKSAWHACIIAPRFAASPGRVTRGGVGAWVTMGVDGTGAMAFWAVAAPLSAAVAAIISITRIGYSLIDSTIVFAVQGLTRQASEPFGKSKLRLLFAFGITLRLERALAP
ncbi:MAG: hypothetical protein B7Y49_10350 [Sphingomonas sp. 28-62-11]|nr:MAG: hypothetical protein B7Y49_10350 [Sphingomonas sp. 28-62-11]